MPRRKKLKLSCDALAVETFAPAVGGQARGTVNALSTDQFQYCEPATNAPISCLYDSCLTQCPWC